MNPQDLDLSLYGGQDPRFKPIYSLAQAARLAGVPISTLRAWSWGRNYPTTGGARFFEPVLEIPSLDDSRLSFVNVIEAHVLAALRREYRMKLDGIRAALHYVRRELKESHPLATRTFETDGVHLFVERFGTLINAASGQSAMREFLQAHLKRVEYDGAGQSIQLFPFVSRQRDETSLQARLEAPSHVFVNPFIGFGKPLLAGKGIPAAIVADRFDAGESVQELAFDLDCEPELIEDALRYHVLAA